MQHFIIATIAFAMLCSNSMAQLSFHMDPNRNSFTIQTPSLQQSYTRFYGNTRPSTFQQQQQQNINALASPFRNTVPSYNNNFYYQQQQQQQQQQHQQQQQNQFVPTNSYTNPYSIPYQTQYQPGLTQKNQQLNQQNQFNTQQYSQLQQPQPTSLAAEDVGAYFQEVQRSQQQGENPTLATNAAGISTLNNQQQRIKENNNAEQIENNNLLGVLYSPSDKVSQVKFSSGSGLNYSF